jgi:HK97 family phage portal protein
MAGESNNRMKMLTRLAALPAAAKAAIVNWTRAGQLNLSDLGGWISGGRAHVKPVSDSNMMSLTAAFRSVKLITETVGSLPLHLMASTDDVPMKATNHPLYDKLHSKASKFQTSDALIEQLCMSLCLWNDAYIRHPGIGNYSDLYALSAAFVEPEAINNGTEVVYHVTENGRTTVLTLDEITPIHGFRWPGALKGMALAGQHQAALSLAIAAEDFGAKFFSTGGRPSGVLSTDVILKADQREQIRTKYQRLLQGSGLDSMGDIHILEAGLKYNSISTNPDEAQFLSTRKYAVHEMARIFGVPPHMLYEMDRATYANAEQNNKEFLTYTLLPYIRRIEKAINAFMLSDADRKKYFAKFSVEGLLRADSTGRAAFYREGRAGGWLTQNEIRGFENLARVDGADDLHVPLNMAPSDKLMDVLGKDTDTEAVSE